MPGTYDERRDDFFKGQQDYWSGGRDLSNPADLYDDLANNGPRRDGSGGDGRGSPATTEPAAPAGPAPEAPFRGINGPDLSQYLNGARGFSGGGSGGGAMGFDLASLMLARGGQLGQLDQRTEDQLAAQKNAEMMALTNTMAEQNASMTMNMFGRGVERSTIAGRFGGQLSAQQGMAAAQVEGAAGARDIAVRQDVANRSVAEAQVAQQDLSSQRQAAVGMAGVAAENNRTAAMITTAAMDNATRMAIAEGQLGLGYAELDLNKELGFGDLDLRRYGIDKQFELGKYQADASKTKWWQSLLGAAGGIATGVANMYTGGMFGAATGGA